MNFQQISSSHVFQQPTSILLSKMPKAFLIKRESCCLVNGSCILQTSPCQQDTKYNQLLASSEFAPNESYNKSCQWNVNFTVKAENICKFRGLKINSVKTSSSFSIKDILLMDKNNDLPKEKTKTSFGVQNCYQYHSLSSDELIPSPQASILSIEEDNEEICSSIYPENTTKIFFPKINNSSNIINTFRQYQCEICLKQFQRSSSLSNHRLIHKNNKSYRCKQCGTCFLRKSDLEKHTIIHSGNKPYQCHTCGKRFSQSSNMLTHQRRHTGVRPYSCSFCGKCFYRKVDVRRHATIHRAH
ncbi:zinc finger protein Gfi-1b [Hydra vulgaris]|uniref:zinc finger protein Gfi-1b n=1 Tax=Hydra vulgaris TaxID=6087 RepID=UPI001F5F31DC|nr:zinc finger protein Gfi-1b [Hydra vulgaris]